MADENQTMNTGSRGTVPTNGSQTVGTIQPVKVVPAVTAQVQTNAPVEQNNLEHNEQVSATINTQAGATYTRLETKNKEGQVSGIIELDLISFREKGEENRYLSLETMGVGDDGNQVKISLAIDNEEDFNVFKKFISNLNWND